LAVNDVVNAVIDGAACELARGFVDRDSLGGARREELAVAPGAAIPWLTSKPLVVQGPSVGGLMTGRIDRDREVPLVFGGKAPMVTSPSSRRRPRPWRR